MVVMVIDCETQSVSQSKPKSRKKSTINNRRRQIAEVN